MKDWLFYPLSAIMIAGMIFAALSISSDFDIDTSDGFITDGKALSYMTPSPGTTIKPLSATEDHPHYITISAHTTRENAPPSAGVFATLIPDFEAAFSDQLLTITIMARKGQSNPTESFEAGYFTAGMGDSGWKTFTLEETFQTYRFDFKLHSAQDPLTPDFVGIWPDPKGQQRTMDLKWIKVQTQKSLSPKPSD